MRVHRLTGICTAALLLLVTGYLMAAESNGQDAPPRMLLAHLQWDAATDAYTLGSVDTADANIPVMRLPKTYTPQHHWVVRVTNAKGDVVFEDILKAQPFVRVPPVQPGQGDTPPPAAVPVETAKLLVRLPWNLDADATLHLYRRLPDAGGKTERRAFAQAYRDVFQATVAELKKHITR